MYIVHTTTSRVGYKKACGDNFIFYMFLDKKQSNYPVHPTCQQLYFATVTKSEFKNLCGILVYKEGVKKW